MMPPFQTRNSQPPIYAEQAFDLPPRPRRRKRILIRVIAITLYLIAFVTIAAQIAAAL